MSISKEEINNLLEESNNFQYVELNEKNLEELITTVNKNYNKNIELRKKSKNYMDYIQIEEQLNEDISVLQRVSAYPKLIPFFIKLKGIELIIEILNHPNIDIVNKIVNLIQEMTESNFLINIEEPKSFIELLLNYNLFDLLIENLEKIDKEYSEDTIQYKLDILSIIENYFEVYPLTAEILGNKNKNLYFWLLKTLKENINKYINLSLFCAEILYQLLENNKNLIIFSEIEGLTTLITIILQENILFNNEKKDNAEYLELINNIIDCICISLFEEKNVKIFIKSNGIINFINLMKDNNIFRNLTLKVLKFALNNNKINCDEFINNNGLSVLFSYFMGKGIKKNDKKDKITKNEENVIEIIYYLIKNTNGIHKERLIYKFKENNYEKLKRLINYYYKYYKKYLELYENKNNNELDEENKNQLIYFKKLIEFIILFLYKLKDDKNFNKLNFFTNKINELINISEINELIN